MELENIIKPTKKFVKENKHFCISSSLFTLTAIADSYFTINGINSGVNSEWNPTIKFFMDYLGIEGGMITCKIIGASMLGLYYKFIQRNTFPIYGVSLGQGVGALLWYFHP